VLCCSSSYVLSYIGLSFYASLNNQILFVSLFIFMTVALTLVITGQGVCGCERFSSSSIGDVLRTIINRDGYAGLMRGWKPRMLFHAPAAAICWSTYEASKSFYERWNEARRK
jgi:hypothetical protein